MTPKTTAKVERVSDEELRAEIGPRLDVFEGRYGLPSSRLEDAFRVGEELVENEDFLIWQRLYTTWRNAGGITR